MQAWVLLDNYLKNPSEISSLLKKIRQEDEEKFHEYLAKIPEDILGEVLLELPGAYKEEALEQLSVEKLVGAI